jgi:hypothetical protein
LPWAISTGDPWPDLAVANEAGNSISVLLGNGDGTYQNQIVVATASQPRSVAVADMNGDGQNDLVVANSGSSTVSVLLNQGTGGFFSNSEDGVTQTVNPARRLRW